MLIGIGLAAMQNTRIDWTFIVGTFFTKFIIWPVSVLGCIWLDVHITHLFSQNVHNVLLLLSLVPLASNTVAIASALNTHPEKAAVAVFLSTALGLVLIPVVFTWIL